MQVGAHRALEKVELVTPDPPELIQLFEYNYRIESKRYNQNDIIFLIVLVA